MPPKPLFDAYYFEVILKKAASIERAGKAGSMVNRPKVSTEKENNNKMCGIKTVKEIHLYEHFLTAIPVLVSHNFMSQMLKFTFSWNCLLWLYLIFRELAHLNFSFLFCYLTRIQVRVLKIGLP